MTDAKREEKKVSKEEKVLRRQTSKFAISGTEVQVLTSLIEHDHSRSKSALIAEAKTRQRKVYLVDADGTLISVPDPNADSTGNALNLGLLNAIKAVPPDDFIIFTQRNKYLEYVSLSFDSNHMSTTDLLQGVRKTFADLKDSDGKPITINIHVSSTMDPFVSQDKPFQYFTGEEKSYIAFIAKVKQYNQAKTQLANLRDGSRLVIDKIKKRTQQLEELTVKSQDAKTKPQDIEQQKQKLSAELKDLNAELPKLKQQEGKLTSGIAALQTDVFREIVDDLLIIQPDNKKLIALKNKSENFIDDDCRLITNLGQEISLNIRSKVKQFSNLRSYLMPEGALPASVTLIDDEPRNHREIVGHQIVDPNLPSLGFVHAALENNRGAFRDKAEYERELKLNIALAGCDPAVIEAAKEMAATIKAGITAYEIEKTDKEGDVNTDKLAALEKMWAGVFKGNAEERDSAIESTKFLRRKRGFGTTLLYKILSGSWLLSSKYADVHTNIDKLTDLIKHAKLIQEVLNNVKQMTAHLDLQSEENRGRLEVQAVALAAALEKYQYALSPMQLSIVTEFYNSKPRTFMDTQTRDAFSTIGARIAAENTIKSEQKAVAEKEFKATAKNEAMYDKKSEPQ